ncbi:MAG: hypothetical protein WBS20_10975 [Lysobacterales bacterium]
MTQNQDLPPTLDAQRLAEAATSLARLDEDMAWILNSLGTPPLWDREQGFVTLLRIILEQQVSLVSAEAMFHRLRAHIDPLTPETVLAAGTTFLRSFGMTRQKSSYFINLAQAIQSGEIDLQALALETDQSVIERLTSVNGIGPWTAKIYLLMALCRPDVWPNGDIALATALQKLKGLEKRPAQPELSELAQAWSPHRATAARLLWHYYLSGMQPRTGKRR